MQVLTDDFELPTIIVEAEARYLCGFPLLIALTFSNDSPETEFYGLPKINILRAPDSIALRLEPIKEGAPLNMPPSSYRAGVPRLTLEPGQQRRMALDLSNFGLDIQPGTYRLTLALHVSKYSRRSNPVTVEFVKPSPEDVIEAARLRRLGDSPLDTGAWAPFLTDNRNTITVSPNLSRDAGRQLALHLFLHRAFYGPKRVAQLDLARLKEITGPVLGAEAALLEFEILTVRNQDAAAHSLGQEMMRRWPGLRFRLDRIAEGKGLLTNGREWFGAEEESIKPDD